MTDNPQTEQVAKTSLAEELKAAFDKAGKDVPEIKEVIPNEEPSAEGESETSEETEEVLTEEDVGEVTEKELPLIPNNWSEEEKESFQALLDSEDPEKRMAAEILIERYNHLKKGFFNKTLEYSQKTKEIKEVDEVFQPYKGQMETQGISKTQYIKNMIAIEQQINRDPAGTIKGLMQRYGVKPEQVVPNNWNYDLTDENQNDNSEVATLKAELATLKARIANLPVEAQILSFENAKDSTGKLLHPRFKEVAPIMGNLLTTDKNLTLEKAYEKAIKVFNEEEETPAVDLNKIREKVAKAKKASKSVTTKGGRPDYSKMSIKEELAAKLIKK